MAEKQDAGNPTEKQELYREAAASEAGWPGTQSVKKEGKHSKRRVEFTNEKEVQQHLRRKKGNIYAYLRKNSKNNQMEKSSNKGIWKTKVVQRWKKQVKPKSLW